MFVPPVRCYKEPRRVLRSDSGLGTVILAVLYAVDPEASPYGRLLAALAVATSFVLPTSTVGQILTLSLQLAVSVFVLVRMKLLAASR